MTGTGASSSDPAAHPGRAMAASLGPMGLWTAELSRVDASEARTVVQRLDARGLSTLWISEGATSKEIFSHAAVLLSSTEQLVVGSGIANIYARDAQAMANGARTLGDAFPGRFVLGLGVSHAPRVQQRGGTWRSPLTMMTEYLDAMDSAPWVAPEPALAVPRVIGALGPRMSELAADRTAGVLPFFVPIEHIRRTRELIGSAPLIAVEQMVILDTDASRARSRARRHTAHYLSLDNYRKNLLRLGFEEGDLEGGGSDLLVDQIVAWGDAAQVMERIVALQDAGADHVCLQILDEDLRTVAERMVEFIGG
jgi:probable F420-dependent oxidoreductase